MSRLVLNRDGGSADQYGHLLALSRSFVGEVIEGLVVAANATPNMAVRVPAGSARIPTGAAPSNYHFFVSIDTASPGESVTIATADAANPRRDVIVAYVDLTVTPSLSPANNLGMLKLLSVAGTPAATPSDPSASQIQAAVGASNPYIRLARVTVGANVTQISSGNITDLRTMLSIGANTVNNAALQVNAVEADNLHANAIMLGFAKRTSQFSTSSTSFVQVPGLSAAVTIPAGGRNVEITFFSKNLYNPNNSSALVSIWDGAVGTGTQLAESQAATTAAGSTNIGFCRALLEAPAAGTKTFNIGMRAIAGTAFFDASTISPALLEVKVV